MKQTLKSVKPLSYALANSTPIDILILANSTPIAILIEKLAEIEKAIDSSRKEADKHLDVVYDTSYICQIASKKYHKTLAVYNKTKKLIRRYDSHLKIPGYVAGYSNAKYKIVTFLLRIFDTDDYNFLSNHLRMSHAEIYRLQLDGISL